MKTSNKILIGGFGFLVILVIAFLISGKVMLDRELKTSVMEQPVSIVKIVG